MFFRICRNKKAGFDRIRIKASRDWFLRKISNVSLTKNTTGSGIIDKSIVQILKKIEDPYPYFRGLVSEISNDIATIKFSQPSRKFRKTKNNFFTLYEMVCYFVVYKFFKYVFLVRQGQKSFFIGD